MVWQSCGRAELLERFVRHLLAPSQMQEWLVWHPSFRVELQERFVGHPGFSTRMQERKVWHQPSGNEDRLRRAQYPKVKAFGEPPCCSGCEAKKFCGAIPATKLRWRPLHGHISQKDCSRENSWAGVGALPTDFTHTVRQLTLAPASAKVKVVPFCRPSRGHRRTAGRAAKAFEIATDTLPEHTRVALENQPREPEL